VSVGAGQDDGEARTCAVKHDVPLGARLAAVGRIRADRIAFFLGTDEASTETRDQSISPARLRVEALQHVMMDPVPQAGTLPGAQPTPASHPRAASDLERQPFPRDCSWLVISHCRTVNRMAEETVVRYSEVSEQQQVRVAGTLHRVSAKPPPGAPLGGGLTPFPWISSAQREPQGLCYAITTPSKR